MWQLIINPFTRISEKKLLYLGLSISILAGFYGFYFDIVFDGVFDIHKSKITAINSFIYLVINILSLVVLLFALGKIINKKTRFIDILVVALVSRIPIYLVSLSITGNYINTINEKIKLNIQNPEKMNLEIIEILFLIFMSLSMLFGLIHSVILQYHGFKNASNAKNWKPIVGFAIALLISEFLSKYLILLIS